MKSVSDKQANREPATGLTMQERAQKNCLDERLEARVAEIVQAKGGEHDPED